MAPSLIVKDSDGPLIFQPVKSLPLKRLVNPGSTAGVAACRPAANIKGTSLVMKFMAGESTTDDGARLQALSSGCWLRTEPKGQRAEARGQSPEPRGVKTSASPTVAPDVARWPGC